MDISASQRPTVTGDTLNPLALILSLWACSLVAMLVMVGVVGTVLYQSLSAIALVLIHTLVYMLLGLMISDHAQTVAPITLTVSILVLNPVYNARQFS